MDFTKVDKRGADGPERQQAFPSPLVLVATLRGWVYHQGRAGGNLRLETNRKGYVPIGVTLASHRP